MNRNSTCASLLFRLRLCGKIWIHFLWNQNKILRTIKWEFYQRSSLEQVNVWHCLVTVSLYIRSSQVWMRPWWLQNSEMTRKQITEGSIRAQLSIRVILLKSTSLPLPHSPLFPLFLSERPVTCTLRWWLTDRAKTLVSGHSSIYR